MASWNFRDMINFDRKRGRRLGIEKYYGYVLALIAGYATADLIIQNTRHLLLPPKTATVQSEKNILPRTPTKDVYDSIVARNPFNSLGLIPEPLTASGGGSLSAKNDAPPVISKLPINLVGTIVHFNPRRSVATIEVKGKNVVSSFMVGDSIEGIASLVAVERRKAIIRNGNNNRLEYIELTLDEKIKFGGVKSSGNEIVQRHDENNFSISRQILNELSADLPNILQDARAVPNRSATGEINGFRMLDIKPGSIYEKLGIQRMDVIKTVNGEPVDSPGKAMEMYNALKNSTAVTLGIERGGRDTSLSYSITK